MTLSALELVNLCRPALESGDADALAALLREHCTVDQLCQMLREGDAPTRKVGAVGLTLIGEPHCSGCLARALRDEDDEVADMAENGLWSLWCRAGSPPALEVFQKGIALLNRSKPLEAIEAFARAHEIDPDFAEAYNQRAICHYLLEQYELSIHYCELTLAHVQHHFGALAGKGHCHAYLGHLSEALDSYRRALSVHPRMVTVAATIKRLEDEQRRRGDASDGYDAIGA